MSNITKIGEVTLAPVAGTTVNVATLNPAFFDGFSSIELQAEYTGMAATENNTDVVVSESLSETGIAIAANDITGSNVFLYATANGAAVIKKERIAQSATALAWMRVKVVVPATAVGGKVELYMKRFK